MINERGPACGQTTCGRSQTAIRECNQYNACARNPCKAKAQRRCLGEVEIGLDSDRLALIAIVGRKSSSVGAEDDGKESKAHRFDLRVDSSVDS